MMKFLLALLLTTIVKGFVPSSSTRQGSMLYSTAEEVAIEPKDAVKLFGRLAEKYIMLDESGGMCCYSACKDCEYRLPDGGYKMADQSAARPKWIPVYEERSFAGQNKEHKAKWTTEIFTEGPSVTKEEFVSALTEMQYAPPLGGPFVGATAAQIEDTAAAEKLFDILAGEKEKLARFKMSLQLKELSGGEQGLTWKDFAAAMGV
eukprot:CAMPEP_0113610542 /NCGR_PEP_ID=MMETSP0017_2-20120614/5083_1 /TAXON_ID=2856 /ORGANISM="Cylindrotheca closterium" /LENGTH=204 /DNA_ID=CAMNT_0000519439 /DNA_START=8 /DNA_END=622 /DNA_ORIENTATION=- /assembly_acc=CAM_ASM_000147